MRFYSKQQYPLYPKDAYDPVHILQSSVSRSPNVRDFLRGSSTPSPLRSVHVTLWHSLSEKKIRDKNLSPLSLRQLKFRALFRVYFEGLLRALFSSLLISSYFLKCGRGSDEVKVTSGANTGVFSASWLYKKWTQHFKAQPTNKENSEISFSVEQVAKIISGPLEDTPPIYSKQYQVSSFSKINTHIMSARIVRKTTRGNNRIPTGTGQHALTMQQKVSQKPATRISKYS